MSADISLSLPCSSEAPRLARDAVSRFPGIDPVRDDALLIVSELVANAVLHSGAADEDSIALRVHRSPDCLTICVRDAGRSPGEPHVRSDGALGHGGFGLMLVDSLTRRWDTHHDDGRVVWAEIGVPEPGASVAA